VAPLPSLAVTLPPEVTPPRADDKGVGVRSAIEPHPAPLLLAAGAGFVGSLCVAAGVAQRGSPFTVAAPGAWFFGSRAGTGGGGADIRFLGIMLVYVGVALLLGSWYRIVRTVRANPGSSIRPLLAILGAWELPVVLSAPLFSRDVYSYAAQGDMVTKGINPYTRNPSALHGGRFLTFVDPLWRHSPAPYGPAWERLSGWIVQLSGHDVLRALVGFRLVALIGVTLVACGVPVLARSLGGAGAFALAVMNPLVILDLVGGSHNDALMLGLLVVGCALARRRHVLAGLVLCALAAEVKIPALVGAVFIGWWWAGVAPTWRRRLSRVVLAVGFAAALMAVLGAVSGLGWRWISGLSDSGTVVSWLDPATAVGLLVAHGASALGYGGHRPAFIDGARVVGLGLATLISIRLVLRSDRLGPVAALGWSLLAFVVLGPVVWPWYESWAFVFLAIEAEGWVVPLIFILSAVACYADVPSPRLLITANPVLVSLCWAGVAAAVCVSVVKAARRGTKGERIGPFDHRGDDRTTPDAGVPLATR
jgi:hypothetical protein